ncbi:MAG: hypothetical protein RMK52_00300 [Chitinophagales bacterium]|nr:hypothetical protein [Chitinophagales bacterium]MDW8392666.1 hypothetical protein [Chitinophagales bacterium]
MMRRYISLLLLLVFVTASVGVVHVHYTCKLTPEALMASKSCCDEGTDACCDVEVLLLRLKDTFVSATEKKICQPPAQMVQPVPLAEWFTCRSYDLLDVGSDNDARVAADRVPEVLYCCFLI